MHPTGERRAGAFTRVQLMQKSKQYLQVVGRDIYGDVRSIAFLADVLERFLKQTQRFLLGLVTLLLGGLTR